MSYWNATDKVPIEQHSVRIPAENGVNYKAGQEIRIRIDPGLKFFNPSQSYLEADVLIQPPTYSSASGTNPKPTRLQLDAETGFQSLCRTVRIHDSNGTLLEEYENYNTLVSVMYDYHSDKSIKGRRALTEGATTYNPANRGTLGSTKSEQSNLMSNPYFTPIPSGASSSPISASWAKTDFVNAKVCIPIKTGIMSNDKIFPNMLMGGITITILLEDSRYCFRQLESVMRFRKLNMNPKFHGINSAGGSMKAVGTAEVYFKDVNSQWLDVAQCPFVVGEKIGFEKTIASGNASNVVYNTWVPEVQTIEYDTPNHKIYIGYNASAPITGLGPVAADNWYAYSRSVSDAASYDVTYLVQNVNLIVQEVRAPAQYEAEMMRKMREGGTINYDFLSFTCYKYSQLVSDRVANIRIPINNTRAKSILCVPLDSSVYSTKQILDASETYQIQKEGTTLNPTNYRLRSCRPNLEGVVDNLTNYQFLYDQRLQPSRRVDTTKISSKTSISGQHLIELDKALSQAGITGHSMARFNQNFVIGRALSLGNATYNAVNKDFNLQVNYQEDDPQTKPHLWCCFVAHVRRIEMRSGNVSVIV